MTEEERTGQTTGQNEEEIESFTRENFEDDVENKEKEVEETEKEEDQDKKKKDEL